MSIDPKQPTREELEEDVSIDADFDTVLDRIIDGHGTDEPIKTCEGYGP